MGNVPIDVANRRGAARRSALDIQLCLVELSEGRSAMLLDVSELGIGVQAVEGPGKGHTTSFRFLLPDTTTHIEGEGEISWVDKAGRMGIRFTRIQPEMQAEVRKWVSSESNPLFADEPVTEEVADLDARDRVAQLEARIIVSGWAQIQALNFLVDQIAAMTQAGGVAIAVEDGTGIVCKASSGIAPQVGVRVDPRSGLSWECVRTREVVNCVDTENDPRVDRIVCRQLRMRSAMLVPVKKEGRVAGLVEVFSSQPHAFSNQTVILLRRVAEAVAGLDETAPELPEEPLIPMPEPELASPASKLVAEPPPKPKLVEKEKPPVDEAVTRLDEIALELKEEPLIPMPEPELASPAPELLAEPLPPQPKLVEEGMPPVAEAVAGLDEAAPELKEEPLIPMPEPELASPASKLVAEPLPPKPTLVEEEKPPVAEPAPPVTKPMLVPPLALVEPLVAAPAAEKPARVRPPQPTLVPKPAPPAPAPLPEVIAPAPLPPKPTVITSAAIPLVPATPLPEPEVAAPAPSAAPSAVSPLVTSPVIAPAGPELAIPMPAISVSQEPVVPAAPAPAKPSEVPPPVPTFKPFAKAAAAEVPDMVRPPLAPPPPVAAQGAMIHPPAAKPAPEKPAPMTEVSTVAPAVEQAREAKPPEMPPTPKIMGKAAPLPSVLFIGAPAAVVSVAQHEAHARRAAEEAAEVVFMPEETVPVPGRIGRIVTGVAGAVLVAVLTYSGWYWTHPKTSVPDIQPAASTVTTSSATSPSSAPAGAADSVSGAAPSSVPAQPVPHLARPSAAPTPPPASKPRVFTNVPSPESVDATLVPRSTPVQEAAAPSLDVVAPPNTVGVASVLSAPVAEPRFGGTTVSRGVSGGQQLVRIQPTYPPAARAMRLSGIVTMQAFIDKKGNVSRVVVLKGNTLLSRAAAEAVRRWKYEPFYLNGEPIENVVNVEVRFDLPR